MVTPESLPVIFLPLHSPQAVLETVGGKALNLAKLSLAGFAVPNGFFIPTDVYRQFVDFNQLTVQIERALQGLETANPAALTAAAASIQTAFQQGVLPDGLTSALEIAWHWLGAPPVAVRSSATAEDLPDLSFAGQQDTYLNVIGVDSLAEAVVGCWASLWTARAIGYRARNGISHQQVALAIVVQKMVPAVAAGVLFTANPLTGKRAEVVIDATLGLGEALVSGQVQPDHYTFRAGNTGDCHLEKTLGAKATVIAAAPEGGTRTEQTAPSGRQAIPDEIILELARLGRKIEALYDFPQDIEWAVTSVITSHHAERKSQTKVEAAAARNDIFILQSRPITSLYPLPETLPAEPLRVLIGLHLVQGVMEPYTPLGQDTLKLLLTSGGRVFGLRHTIESQTAFFSAAERLWINVTPIIRNPVGRKGYLRGISAIDPAMALIIQKLLNDDPRLAPIESRPSLRTIGRMMRFAVPFIGRILAVMLRPERAARNTLAAFDQIIAKTKQKTALRGDVWTDFTARLTLFDEIGRILPEFIISTGIPPIVVAMASFFGVLARFAGKIADARGDERLRSLHLEIARGLPNNVTTEMDLRLWETAQTLRADPPSRQRFRRTAVESLAADFLAGKLPAAAQNALDVFLDQYGARGLGEIDLGRPRWREEPVHVIQTIQSYLKISDPDQAPAAVFARGAQSAVAAAEELAAAVQSLPHGRLKSWLVRAAARRYRALGGLREAPKFFIIRMMGLLRAGLLASGEDFTRQGWLDQADDLFFLHIAELQEIAVRQVISPEERQKIARQRAIREREMRRRRLPRLMLSDGTTFYDAPTETTDDGDNVLHGDPVSPGVVEGVVRVVFNPHETQLQPGEILVCPGTDPAWTPLFLAAGGLVMEVGGMMTHGSVVAREYGIPAVVGVRQATERLQTGQCIRVDGSSGRIELL